MKKNKVWTRCECEKGKVYGPWFECYTISLACIDCKPKNHKWAMCSMCGAMIMCAKCGNNSCNAGSGTINGKVCNTCSDSWEFQKNNKPPFLLRVREWFWERKKRFEMKYCIIRANILNKKEKYFG